MAYRYEEQVRTLLDSPENLPKIIRAKQRIDGAVKSTGAITYAKALGMTGQSDSWQALATLDYLVAEGFYRRVHAGDLSQNDILVPVV